jgi:hypothetical protein
LNESFSLDAFKDLLEDAVDAEEIPIPAGTALTKEVLEWMIPYWQYHVEHASDSRLPPSKREQQQPAQAPYPFVEPEDEADGEDYLLAQQQQQKNCDFEKLEVFCEADQKFMAALLPSVAFEMTEEGKRATTIVDPNNLPDLTQSARMDTHDQKMFLAALTNASHYLECIHLSHLLECTVISKIRNRTPEAIRIWWEFPENMTAEEEAQMRKEFGWEDT